MLPALLAHEGPIQAFQVPSSPELPECPVLNTRRSQVLPGAEDRG